MRVMAAVFVVLTLLFLTVSLVCFLVLTWSGLVLTLIFLALGVMAACCVWDIVRELREVDTDSNL